MRHRCAGRNGVRWLTGATKSRGASGGQMRNSRVFFFLGFNGGLQPAYQVHYYHLMLPSVDSEIKSNPLILFRQSIPRTSTASSTWQVHSCFHINSMNSSHPVVFLHTCILNFFYYTPWLHAQQTHLDNVHINQLSPLILSVPFQVEWPQFFMTYLFF